MKSNSDDGINFNAYSLDLNSKIGSLNEEKGIDYQRNMMLKQQLKTLDFNKINDLYNYMQTGKGNKTGGKETGGFYETLRDKLVNDIYHVKGKISKMSRNVLSNKSKNSQIISTEILFGSLMEIIVDDGPVINVKLNGIKKVLLDNIFKLINKSTIYMTNLKANVIQNPISNKFEIFFQNSINTKIYYEQNLFSDCSNSNSANTSSSDMQIDSPNKDNIKSSFFGNSLSNLTIDLTLKNEMEYISVLDLDEFTMKIRKFENQKLDYNQYLMFHVYQDIFDLKVSVSQYQLPYDKKTSIYGLIMDINIINNSNARIEVHSLINHATMAVNVYNCRSLFVDLKKYMVVEFQNYRLRINKYYDIDLGNSAHSQNEILCMLNESDIKQFLKTKNLINQLPLITFLSLTTDSIIERRICKFFVIIKEIIKIDAYFEDDYNGINKFEGLKIKGKLLLDDGSFEALGYFKDKEILSIFGFTDEELNDLYDKVIERKQVSLYQRYGNAGILTQENYKNAFSRQFIVYGQPFAKLYSKFSRELGGYEKYFESTLAREDQLKIYNKDIYGFINGEAEVEKNLSKNNKAMVIKRPMIRISNIEIIE